jgi:outer membrane scaffolding protein for murein synthesis (MipA/OmpV family)
MQLQLSRCVLAALLLQLCACGCAQLAGGSSQLAQGASVSVAEGSQQQQQEQWGQSPWLDAYPTQQQVRWYGT